MTPEETLYQAALAGHAGIVRRLLEQGVAPGSAVPNGNTALHAAALAREIEIMEMLMAAGADVNALNKGSQTPLYLALSAAEMRKGAAKKSLRGPMALLKRFGADPNRGLPVVALLDRSNMLYWPSKYGRREISAWLQEDALKGYDKLVGALLDAGLDPGMTDSAGQTLLHKVCRQYRPGMEALLQRLLDHGWAADKADGLGQTPLHTYLSSSTGHASGVSRLLAAGADVNAVNPMGQSPAHVFFERVGDPQSRSGVMGDALKRLVRAGADFDLADQCGVTPRDVLFRPGNGGWTGSRALCRMILSAMPEPLCKPNNQYLFDEMSNAMKSSDRDRALELLQGVSPDSYDITGGSLLSLSLWADREDCFEALLAAGADINRADYDGYTPLMAAAEHGRLWAVRRLLDKGADVQALDYHGGNVLRAALKAGRDKPYEELVRVLLEHGADAGAPCCLSGASSLHKMCEHQRSDQRDAAMPAVATLLVGAGADVNSLDAAGCRPIHMENLTPELLGCLSALGADMNLTDLCGRNALHAHVYPKKRGVSALLNALVLAGTDINRVDDNGHTPLMRAVSKKNAEAALALLAAGADPAAGKATVEALYEGKVRRRGVDNSLSAERRRDLLRELIRAGLPCDDVADSLGNTLLHNLCKLNAPKEDIMIVLAHCQDINLRNHRGETPLMALLRSRGQGRVAPVEGTVKLLLDHGADSNMTDDADVLPFDALVNAAETSRSEKGVKGRDRQVLALLEDSGASTRRYGDYLRENATDCQARLP